MHALSKKDPLLLFVGDIAIFFASLWLMLFVRYWEIPDEKMLQDHLLPFSILFLAWFLIFYIAGLYEKRAVILKNRLPATLLKAQIANTVVAVIFFYFIPYFGITPKTNLFIYLAISFFLVLIWRIYGYVLLGPTRKQNAILISSGKEMKELRDEVNSHARYNLAFISSVDLDSLAELDFKEEILNRIFSEDVSVIVIDFKNEKIEPILPALYNLISSKIMFIDMHRIYEDVFDRIPLSLIEYSWFLENISLARKSTYDFLKRIMDIALGFSAGLASLIFYPFVILAIKLDDGGPIFSVQERVGQDNKPIKLFKFRTMSKANDGGKWGEGNVNKITRVGNFLRRSRLDEIPQLWNVVAGHVSLIGPRPEFADAVKKYEQEIPYYAVRHLIKPGLSGWAQIYHDNHPHHGVAVEQTKEKLSYDLFYLKNRSFILDITIALKTVSKLLSIMGV